MSTQRPSQGGAFLERTVFEVKVFSVSWSAQLLISLMRWQKSCLEKMVTGQAGGRCTSAGGSAAESAAERLTPKRHHGRFPASPNMAQTPLCSSPVLLRRFPPISDLTDAISACIPPRQRKIFAVARLLEAGGVLEAISDAHGHHDVPVALPTTANAGACHVDGYAACWGRLPIGTVRHCAIYRVEMSRSPCDRSCNNSP